MRAHWKPILTLVVVAPLLTELLTNNLPPSVFFNPLVFLTLVTISYGFPILLLRELAVRKRLGLPGLICLGLVYGIINEGIIAKTFYLATHVPLDTFDGYGYTLGIAVPWAITISVWHAAHALIYPILVTYFFFPAYRDQPWLTRNWIIGLAIPTSLLCSLVFFTHSNERAPGLLPHFILMLAVMGLLMWIAARLPAAARLSDAALFRIKPIFCGMIGGLLLLLIPILLSRAKIPLILFYGYFLLLGALLFRWFYKQTTLPVTTLLLFAVGDDLFLLGFAFLGALQQRSIQKLVADICFLGVFVWFITRLRHADDVIR